MSESAVRILRNSNSPSPPVSASVTEARRATLTGPLLPHGPHCTQRGYLQVGVCPDPLELLDAGPFAKQLGNLFTPKLTTFFEEKRSTDATIHARLAMRLPKRCTERTARTWLRFHPISSAENAPALSARKPDSKGIVNQLDLHKKKIIYLLNHTASSVLSVSHFRQSPSKFKTNFESPNDRLK